MGAERKEQKKGGARNKNGGERMTKIKNQR